MNWYRIAQILEKVKGKVSPIPSWQREDKVKPVVEQEIYPDIKWPYDKGYLDVGHDPSEKNRSYIWYITRGFEFFMKEVEDHADGHHWWDQYQEDREKMFSISHGRYEVDRDGKNGICSIGSMRFRDDETEKIHKMLDAIKKNFPSGTEFIYFGSKF